MRKVRKLRKRSFRRGTTTRLPSTVSQPRRPPPLYTPLAKKLSSAARLRITIRQPAIIQHTDGLRRPDGIDSKGIQLVGRGDVPAGGGIAPVAIQHGPEVDPLRGGEIEPVEPGCDVGSE